jgi:hypothetical protein
MKILGTFIYHCQTFAKYHTDWVFLLNIPFLPLMIVLTAIASKRLSAPDTETAWRHVNSVLAICGQDSDYNFDGATSPMWQIIQRLKEQALVYVRARENVPQQTSNHLLELSQPWNEPYSMRGYYPGDEMMFDTFGPDPFGDASLVQEEMYADGSLVSPP